MITNYYLLYEKKRGLECAKNIYSKFFIDTKQISELEIFNNLKNDFEKNKFLKTSFFYYYRGFKITEEEDWHKKIDESFVFIALISVVETLMSSEEYLDFGSWLEKNNKSGDAGLLWKEYNYNFGITKKVKTFFNEYISNENKIKFLSSMLIWNDKEKKYLEQNNIDKVADLFYILRSKYVHDSEFVPVSEELFFSFFCKKNYYFKIRFKDIREVLEKSFLNYFLKKSNLKLII